MGLTLHRGWGGDVKNITEATRGKIGKRSREEKKTTVINNVLAILF